MLMHPKKAKKLFIAGSITQREYDDIVDQYNLQQAEKSREEEAQLWMEELKKSNLTQKRKMVVEKAFDLNVESALTDDNFERRQKRSKSSRLNFSLRGSGGFSF